MIVSRKRMAIIAHRWLHASIAIPSSFLLCTVLGTQSASPVNVPMALPVEPPVPFLQAKSPFAEFMATRSSNAAVRNVTGPSGTLPVSISTPVTAPGMPWRITLEEAQEAAAGNNPMARLGQLSVEAARQHRLAAEGDYFPKIPATGANFHFNKFMGEEITIQHPIQDGTSTEGLPLVGKDLTFVSLTAAQPLTPLFKVQLGVAVARADERTAMAKAGMPVEAADDVEPGATTKTAWKITFCEQRAPGNLDIWANPFTCLRLPKIENLRMDPYEHAQISGIGYEKWWTDNAYVTAEGVRRSAIFLQTFIQYPPSQAPGTFSVEGIADEVKKKVAQLEAQAGRAGSAKD